jgi:molybdopterin-guanine dinucleotide biosynthesis protein A
MNSDIPKDCRFAVAILAGGEATRLGGVDKGMTDLMGRPLIEWVIELLGDAARDRLMIVANRSLERYSRYAEVVSDATPAFRGPLAGVAAALRANHMPWLMTVPVDCPRLPNGLPDAFCRVLGRGAPPALVAHDGERRQPLFAMYSSTLASAAAQAVADGLGVARWQDRLGAMEVDCSALGGCWDNLNTPADFSEFTRNRKRDA